MTKKLNRYQAMLKESLLLFWDNVTQLTLEDSQELFKSFVITCVRKDLQKNFYRDFNGNKVITTRYFENYTLQNASDVMFFLKIEVLWGSLEHPIAFSLGGKSTSIDKFFVSEGDAIAKLFTNKKIEYLFLSGARGDLLRIFPKTP